jgi:hypothetical protein
MHCFPSLEPLSAIIVYDCDTGRLHDTELLRFTPPCQIKSHIGLTRMRRVAADLRPLPAARF